MHSQGGIIGSNIVNQLGKEGVDVKGLKAKYYMPGNNRKGALKKLTRHGAKLVLWYQNTGDAVTQVAGFNAITDCNIKGFVSSTFASYTLFTGGRRNSNHSLFHGAIKGLVTFTNEGYVWTPEDGWRKGLPDHLAKNPKHIAEVISYGTDERKQEAKKQKNKRK